MMVATDTGIGAVTFGLGKYLVNYLRFAANVRNTKVLFRAVGINEYKDLLMQQAFKAGVNSLEGKFFATTLENAIKWGTRLEGKGNFRVVKAYVPRDVEKILMRWDSLDGIGPAVYAELDDLVNTVIKVVQ